MAAVFCASFKPPRDGLAQPRHAHALLARGIVGRRRRADLDGAAVAATGVGCAAARSMAASMSPLVTRPSLPVPGTARHRRRIRRRACAPTARAARRGGFARRAWREPAAGSAACGGTARRPSRAAGAGAAPAGAFLDLAEHRADRDGFAVLGGDLAEHAGGRRRHFDRHLVGLELDQRLVDRDRVARLLEPFADGRLGHRFAERRHANLSHGLDSSFAVARTTEDGINGKAAICRPPSVVRYPSASSRNCLSWARCSDICPTAVDAEAGRPA